MSDQFVECKKCGEYSWIDDTHRCAPRWQVWEIDEDREDSVTFYGTDAAEAAEKWAEATDVDGGYTIVGGSEKAVFVAPFGVSEEPVRLFVSGEAVPTYHANTPPPCPPHEWLTVPTYATRDEDSRRRYAKNIERIIEREEPCRKCGLEAKEALA